MKCLVIDDLYMVSSNLWIDVDSRLEEILIVIPRKIFAGISVLTLTDLLTLPPVRGKLIFHDFVIRIV